MDTQQSIMNNNQNNITIFNNPEFGSIRSIMINGEPWFVGKDIALALGYKDTNQAIRNYVNCNDKLTSKINGSGQNRNMIIINESGLYSLIFSSKLPSAQKFQHWVTSEVLPSIRKHGAYMTPETARAIVNDPYFLINIANQLLYEQERNKIMSQQIEQQKPLVNFANQVYNIDGLIDMNIMAKLLYNDDTYIGRTRLFEFLRNKKILMKNNIPYQKYINEEYFQVKENIINNQIIPITLVTGKGQLFIHNLIKNEYNI